MRYIRTTDGRIFEVMSGPDENEWYEQKDGIICLPKKKILKQTNTIEELCDEFVWKWNEKEFPYSKARQYDRYSGYGDLKRAIRAEENYGKYLNYDYEIYGAIWTKWGLKYVAKINNKGELELL